MRYVVITARVIKVNTGSTEKFAPRSSNNTRLYASGPYSLKTAQRVAEAAMGQHTTLMAQIWSEEAVARGDIKRMDIEGVWHSTVENIVGECDRLFSSMLAAKPITETKERSLANVLIDEAVSRIAALEAICLEHAGNTICMKHGLNPL